MFPADMTVPAHLSFCLPVRIPLLLTWPVQHLASGSEELCPSLTPVKSFSLSDVIWWQTNAFKCTPIFVQSYYQKLPSLLQDEINH